MNGQLRTGPAWVAPFLDTLALTGIAQRGFEAAGIAHNTAYHRRRNNARFAQAWKIAKSGDAERAREWAAEPLAEPRNAGAFRLFIEMLGETSCVTAAAAFANLPLTTVYRRRRSDPAFRAQWSQALLEGYEHLEMETLYRLRMGTAGSEPKFDIANALRLLALHRDTAARERVLRTVQDEDAILASLDAKIEAMRAREEKAARLLIAQEPRGSERGSERGGADAP